MARNTHIVFFDFETSGLHHNAFPVQLAMKSGDEVFNRYITPPPNGIISPEAANINHMAINEEGELLKYGQRVESRPREIVINELLDYLRSFRKPCVLVAHNARRFHTRHLLRLIQETGLVESFREVIYGFTDTYILCRYEFPERRNRKGKLKLKTLAAELLNLDTSNHNDALNDASVVEELACHYFSDEVLRDTCQPFDKA